MIMVFEGTHYGDEDVSPFLAALDEETYCEAILPLLSEVPVPDVTDPMPWDEADDDDDYFDGPDDDFDPDGWKIAQNRYDVWVYGP